MEKVIMPCLHVVDSGSQITLKQNADLNSIKCHLLNGEGGIANRDFVRGETATDTAFCIVQNNDEVIVIPPTLLNRQFLFKYDREINKENQDEFFKFPEPKNAIVDVLGQYPDGGYERRKYVIPYKALQELTSNFTIDLHDNIELLQRYIEVHNELDYTSENVFAIAEVTDTTTTYGAWLTKLPQDLKPKCQ